MSAGQNRGERKYADIQKRTDDAGADLLFLVFDSAQNFFVCRYPARILCTGDQITLRSGRPLNDDIADNQYPKRNEKQQRIDDFLWPFLFQCTALYRDE